MTSMPSSIPASWQIPSQLRREDKEGASSEKPRLSKDFSTQVEGGVFQTDVWKTSQIRGRGERPALAS